MTVLMGLHDRSFLVLELGQRQTFPGWIRAGATVVSARRLSADPGVLSTSSMDVQGCLCTQVLGDYLLKVIWDHGVPLIIPESIQHLHLLCASIAPLQRQRKHLQVSVKPASGLKKKHRRWDSFKEHVCGQQYYQFLSACTLKIWTEICLCASKSWKGQCLGFLCVRPTRLTSPAQLNLSNSQWHTCFGSCRARMDGLAVACAAPVLASTAGEEANARLSERWQHVRRVCARSWGHDRKQSELRSCCFIFHRQW